MITITSVYILFLFSYVSNEYTKCLKFSQISRLESRRKSFFACAALLMRGLRQLDSPVSLFHQYRFLDTGSVCTVQTG